MASLDPSPIPSVPPPWTLKGTVYTFMLYVPTKQISTIPHSFLSSPLEKDTLLLKAGEYLGGLASVQIIRYTETPVGPYDELLLVPGKFSYEKENKKGIKEKKENLRITKIFVSQKYTCFNGRKNWNIPKHLATFEFNDLPDGAVRISVFPQSDTTGIAQQTPFFTAVYKPIPYLPNIPFSTSTAKYTGIDLKLVQPPLPDGNKFAKEGELPGTEEEGWCSIMPYQYSKKTSFGWFDLRQREDTEDGDRGERGEESPFENWWPGLGRWRIGMRLEDARIEFPEGERWVEARL